MREIDRALLEEDFLAASKAHQEALAEFRKVEAELAVARGKLLTAERRASDLWNKMLDRAVEPRRATG